MSTAIDLVGLRRTFGPRDAVADVTAHIEPGTLVAVVGPSGSGKTTLLRLVAGLENADAGHVLFDGKPHRGRPEERPTAMVFQSDALFPDLTVAANIGFGLRAHGRRHPERSERVAVAMLRLGLTGLEGRYPDELSGGQRRRVAIARALVAQPRVLLLDEPLAGLDQRLGREILLQVRATQRRLGLTTLLVTHDQEHALLVADAVLVMAGGRIVQAGTPREVFERPESVFVADFWGWSAFVGVRVADVRDGTACVDLLGRPRWLPAHPAVLPGTDAVVMIRPHALAVAPTSRTGPPGLVHEAAGEFGIVVETRFHGDRVEYQVETEHGMLVGTGSLDDDLLEPDADVRLTLSHGRVWVLPTPGASGFGNRGVTERHRPA